MSITVHMPNEKLAKAFLAAKPDNVDAKGVTVKVAKTNRKKIGVVGVTKAENAQLGLILKYIHEDKDALPEEVVQFPEALSKLMSRYS